MTAYVLIRQMPPEVRVVCRPCDVDEESPSYRVALLAVKTHNHDDHEKGKTMDSDDTDGVREWRITYRGPFGESNVQLRTKTIRADRWRQSSDNITEFGELTFYAGERVVFILDRAYFVSAEPTDTGDRAAA